MALLLQSSAVTGTLAILAIGAVAAAIGGFFYMKYRKGSIELHLSRHNYSPGDMLDATLVVTPRQDLFVDEVYVELICTAHWYEYYYDDNDADDEDHHEDQARQTIHFHFPF